MPFLYGSAFLAGAVTMVLEITASRLLAPAFGNTIFCWTGVIGTILAAMSMGYFFGGRLADRHPSIDFYLRIFFISTVLVGALAWGGEAAVLWLSPNLGAKYGPMIASALLFAAPAATLSALPPLAVRLTVGNVSDAGRSAGTISMLSTVGSIAGTFGAGFVLIPTIGTRAIFFFCVGTLGVVTIIGLGLRGRYGASSAVLSALGVIAMGWFIGAPPEVGLIFSEDSQYHRIRVIESGAGRDLRRTLELDSTGEGASYVNRDELAMPYQDFYQIIGAYQRGPKRSLFIGGGAYGMPIHHAKDYPDVSVRVVELDPRVHDVGREFFDLEPSERLLPEVGDGRRFLADRDSKYDYIFSDAYHGVQYIPFHLVTREFFELVRTRLDPGGVFVMNIISALEGSNSALFRSMVATLKTAFRQVDVYPLRPGDKHRSQNIILVAVNSDEVFSISTLRRNGAHAPHPRTMSRLLASRMPFSERTVDAAILVDDFAPVEYMVSGAVD